MADAAYASSAEIADFLGVAVGDLPSDIDRLAVRASELIDTIPTLRPFLVDSDTDLPTDADAATALSEAVAAQIEYWAEIGGGLSNIGGGETHDKLRLSGEQELGGASFPTPGKYAPRAVGILRRVGLLGTGVSQSHYPDRGASFFEDD